MSVITWPFLCFMQPPTKTPWWQPAILLFGKISIWIGGPLLVALFLGKYLDRRFDTKPWIFLGLAALAFYFSCFMIVKIIRAYIKLEKETREMKKDEEVS
jgi:F0F1-type ATP synthase assembly protein I